MKKIKIQHFIGAFLAMGVLLFISSCGDDEPTVTPPSANFTAVVTGTSVAFTDTSVGADSYLWDFGDGTTSTDASPTHDFGKFAAFVVKLTVTNGGGTDDKSEAIQVVAAINIDGDFADWSGVPVASASNSENTGVVTMLKITSNLTHIYVYVEGTAAIGGFVSMYVNSDNDTTTGWAPKDHVFDGAGANTATMAGADFEIDLGGPWSDNSFSTEIWTWVEVAENLEQADWSFEGDEVGSADKFIAPVKSGNAYEFAIVRANWPGGLPETISFLFVDVNIANDDWVEGGFLPNVGEGFITHELFK